MDSSVKSSNAISRLYLNATQQSVKGKTFKAYEGFAMAITYICDNIGSPDSDSNLGITLFSFLVKGANAEKQKLLEQIKQCRHSITQRTKLETATAWEEDKHFINDKRAEIQRMIKEKRYLDAANRNLELGLFLREQEDKSNKCFVDSGRFLKRASAIFDNIEILLSYSIPKYGNPNDGDSKFFEHYRRKMKEFLNFESKLSPQKKRKAVSTNTFVFTKDTVEKRKRLQKLTVENMKKRQREKEEAKIANNDTMERKNTNTSDNSELYASAQFEEQQNLKIAENQTEILNFYLKKVNIKNHSECSFLEGIQSQIEMLAKSYGFLYCQLIKIMNEQQLIDTCYNLLKVIQGKLNSCTTTQNQLIQQLDSNSPGQTQKMNDPALISKSKETRSIVNKLQTLKFKTTETKNAFVNVQDQLYDKVEVSLQKIIQDNEKEIQKLKVDIQGIKTMIMPLLNK